MKRRRNLRFMVPGNREKTVRLFFALWPSAGERESLAAWQAPLQELYAGKVTKSENLHATLAFLGDVALSRLEALKLAAQEVRGRTFELVLDQARYWGHNHIVYAAPTTTPPHLLQLAADLEQGLARHHFHVDKHPEYQPHITLLRHARWSDAPMPQLQESRWRVESFVLVQSVIDSEGSTYRALETFPLHGPGGDAFRHGAPGLP